MRVGAKLLQKTPRGYMLTAAGEAILGNVERIENEALAIERVITGKDIRLEGTVRITTVETLAVEILSPIFQAFQEKYPGIALELIADTRSLSLTKREADVALRLARLTQHDLAVRKVGDFSVALYAAQAYLDRYGLPDLSQGAPGHRRIMVYDDLGSTPDMQWFEALTSQAQVVLRSNSRFAHAAAARDGMGLASLARYLGDSRGLVRLETPIPAPRREIWMAVHQDIRHTPRIRALSEFLTAALKQRAGLLNPP